MTTIRYFIPEDGDSEEYPNVFLAPKPRQQGVPPSLGQVRESFPLPGRYHFRFKCPLVPGGDREKGGMAVWMDCVHDSQMIPTWQNSIIAKVARVAVDEEDDDDDVFGTPAPAPVPPKQQTRTAPPPPPRHMESSEPLLDVFDSSPASALGGSAPSSLHGSAHNSTADLLNASAHAPAPTGGGATLLDMDGPMYSHSSHSAHNDFLGMTAPSPQPQPPQPYGIQQQQARPQQPPQAPRSGGIPMQQAPRSGGVPLQQQQQQRPVQQQQPPPAPRSGNAFDSFSVAQTKDQDQGPFGGLNW